MATLISCVGDTDPIRNFHDGPLLHIARVYRPEKIVLIHSERSIIKHDAIEKALQSIDGYDPIIMQDATVIPNQSVFIFDAMFDLLYPIIHAYYQHEDGVLLNLSSGTPQIISAIFSINRISGYNVRAFQVATPQFASNEGIKHTTGQAIRELIATNKDQSTDFQARIIEDKGEKFNQVLLMRTFADLIQEYDYEGAYRLLLKHKLTSKKKRATMIKVLESLLNLVKFQEPLPDVNKSELNEQEKILLNAFLSIQLQHKRQLISEVLIRTKNLAEAISEHYLNVKYPNLMEYRYEKWYLSKKTHHDLHVFLDDEAKKARADTGGNISFDLDSYLSLPIYVNIFRYLEPESVILTHLNKVLAINHLRNKVAHGFKPLNQKEVKGQNIYAASQGLIKEVLDVEDKWMNYFEIINHDLLQLLGYRDNH